MLYEIRNESGVLSMKGRLVERAASELGVMEKSLENFLSDDPARLFPREHILVIGQSISGQGMADILALDASGRLILVELKRDWSDRATVAQLLEYAARFADVTYESLNEEAQRYTGWNNRGELIDEFRQFADNLEFEPNHLGQSQRIFIVAPDFDETLKSIVKWLSSYGVPISLLPFRLWADEEDQLRLIEIESEEVEMKSPQSPEGPDDEWAGHWIFNTNETHSPGAYQRMFERNVAAIYGYDNGGANLEGSAEGNLVLAYVNRQGLTALGEVVDPHVVPGTGIFLKEDGGQEPGEYHLHVDWEVQLGSDQAISASTASRDFDYNLPVRTVFGRLKRGRSARRLTEEIRRRSGVP